MLTYSTGKPTLHSNIATIHITIAVEQIKILMTKTPWYMDRSCINQCNAIIYSACGLLLQREQPAHDEACSPPLSSPWVSCQIRKIADHQLAVSFEVGGWGKRSRHSRRMRNLQFYVSGKRPILTRAARHAWRTV